MNKPEKTAEIRLSADDVRRAIEDYLNKDNYKKNITCSSVIKTKSKKYFLIAKFD